MKRLHAFAALVIVSSAGIVGLAFAQAKSEPVNDAVAASASAKVTLAQAIGIAESKVPGTVIRAELDNESGHAVYSVEVVTADRSVMDVKVDAVTSTVLSTKPDAPDRGSCEADDD